jgi:hypothetical protein
MQNIEDLTTEPIVGETYMVPCVYGTSSKTGVARCWMPITGPMHSDAEYIGFEPLHFHYDHRFTPDDEWRELLHHGGIFGTPGDPELNVISNRDESRGIARRKMVCLRNVRPYPEVSFHEELNAAYADKRVTCGKCPHRGLPLLSLPREPGTDIVTCVGHGLKWDLKTGALVKGAPCPTP